jgi:hypothetical protein
MNKSPYETTARINRGQYQGYSSLQNTAGGGKPAERCIPTMEVQTVPIWKSLGYNSLTHVATPDGDNYFTINKAYPKPCVNYQFRNCKGQLDMKNVKENYTQPEKIIVEGFAYTF